MIDLRHRILRLIPIPPGLFHPANRLKHLIDFLLTKPADPDQPLAHQPLLERQLLFIREGLQLAASAGLGMRAFRLHAVRRRQGHAQHLCVAVGGFHLGDDGLDLIARQGIFNEKGKSIDFADAFPVNADILDL